MLRALVLLLIVANVAAWAWYDGQLSPYLAPTTGEAAARPRVQHHPERLVVIPPPALLAPPAPPQAPPAPLAETRAPLFADGMGNGTADGAGDRCLQAGPFNATEQAAVAGSMAQRLPAVRWTALQTAPLPGLWLLYMGPFADEDALQRKLSELRRIRNLAFEEVRSPAGLAPGISLGRYTQQEQAEGALETLRVRGIRTARVVTLRPAAAQMVIRVPQVTATVQQQLEALPLPAGRTFGPCPATAGG